MYKVYNSFSEAGFIHHKLDIQSTFSLKSRILVLSVISVRYKPQFWSTLFCLLPLELYLDFYCILNSTQHLFSKFLFLRSYEVNIYRSVVSTFVNREGSGGNMLVYKSISSTYSQGMLETFLHCGGSILGVEVQTSTSILKGNLVLSCKVEYLHSFQPT